MPTLARPLLTSLSVLLGTVGFACHAQTSRACDTYVNGVLAADILGQQVTQNPGNGQYNKDQNLEWHTCDWTAYYPPVAPGAPRNPATLTVSIQRYASADSMREGQLTPQELGPKVKVERVSKLGELGAFYTNSDKNTVIIIGSKGRKVVSISVDMGLNPIRVGARQNLEKVAARLWNEL
jgi:hypothetical protein